VTVEGSRTEYGESSSRITGFVLYDYYKRNVTGDFKVTYKPGRVRILKQIITVEVFALKKFYDGTPLQFTANDYRVAAGLPTGYRLLLSLSGGITDAGLMKLSELEKLPYTVYAANGLAVTDQYSLVFTGEPLTVNKAPLQVTAASAVKAYDGKPLTGELAWLSKGNLPPDAVVAAETEGAVTDIGSANNVIKRLRITDAAGKNITKNFKITAVAGVLTVTK
jgi:hypothetical protein